MEWPLVCGSLLALNHCRHGRRASPCGAGSAETFRTRSQAPLFRPETLSPTAYGCTLAAKRGDALLIRNKPTK